MTVREALDSGCKISIRTADELAYVILQAFDEGYYVDDFMGGLITDPGESPSRYLKNVAHCVASYTGRESKLVSRESEHTMRLRDMPSNISSDGLVYAEDLYKGFLYSRYKI